jgi:hypothetical protein
MPALVLHTVVCDQGQLEPLSQPALTSRHSLCTALASPGTGLQKDRGMPEILHDHLAEMPVLSNPPNADFKKGWHYVFLPIATKGFP